MHKRCLGSTNIEVSAIGLGTVKIGRNQGVSYPASFSLPKDREVSTLLHVASELGINLLDTAPAYGNSEERLGKLLSHRSEWVICTKVGEEFVNGHSEFDFSSHAIRQSIERSLRRLKTDYLDIVLVHANGADEALIREEKVFVTLEELKKQGKIRCFGLSSKTERGGKLTVDLADVAMVTLNPLQTDDQAVIAYAHQQKKGIFIKKAFASGHLEKLHSADPITDALRFIFKEPGVTSIITGTINTEHLEETVNKAEALLTRSDV